MATNRPQGDLVGWRINTTHVWLGKTIEISSLDKKNPILLMLCSQQVANCIETKHA